MKKVITENKLTKKTIIFIYDKKYIKPISIILSIFFLICIESYIHINIDYKYDSIVFNGFNDFNKNNKRIFPQDDITIVTAYYRFRSKHRIFYYNQWMNNFLKINKSMIFFLEKSSFKKIVYKRPKEYINKTIWVFVNINEFYTYKNFYEEYKKSYEIDVEHFRHNVRLYMIWAEKSNFLRTAALKNYFNSKCFYWTDVGNFRNSSNIDNYINWPSTNKCFEDGRVVINERLNKSDYIKDGLIKFDLNIHREFQKSYNVDGSCFGGKREYVIQFCNTFYDMVKIYIQKNIFIGKDQNIMAFIAYSHPNMTKLIYSGRYKYLIEYLS